MLSHNFALPYLVGVDEFAVLVGLLLKTNSNQFWLHFQRSLLFNYLGKPLYAQASEFNDKEFGRIMRRVLLPMALDFHVRSREIDVNELATEELSNLNGDETQKDEAIQVWMLFIATPLFWLFVSLFCVFVCLFAIYLRVRSWSSLSHVQINK